MTVFVMRGSDPHILLSHLALYGLAAILQDAGVDVRLQWTPERSPHPQVDAPDLDQPAIGSLVQQHAASLTAPDAWLAQDITLRGTARGLMTPRLTPFGDDHQTWALLQQRRHDILDTLTTTGRWLDLRQIAALGEPCYWSRSQQGLTMQDDAASRLEMQPRNQGSEIVGSRLRKLAAVVANRDVAQVIDGLCGTAVRDEAGGDKPDSRTATGLANPGPTDNAVAWCALWGISQFPIAMRIGWGRRSGTALTTGHLGRSRREWFYAPVWQHPWRPARLRTILACAQTATAAAAGLPLGADRFDDLHTSAARAWLATRHVIGLVRFPVGRFGSDSAPERRALRGQPLPTRING